MRSHYGKCGSWAVWNSVVWQPEPSKMPELKLDSVVEQFQQVSNQEDLDAHQWGLRDDVVLVALNFAGRDAKIDQVVSKLAFGSFHEEIGRTSDRRLRDACLAAGLGGSYITDLVKMSGGKVTPFRESKSELVAALLRDVGFLKEQIQGLVGELKTLGCASPALIGLGGDVYTTLAKPAVLDTLRAELGAETSVVKMTHYSARTQIKVPDYIDRVKQELAGQPFLR